MLLQRVLEDVQYVGKRQKIISCTAEAGISDLAQRYLMSWPSPEAVPDTLAHNIPTLCRRPGPARPGPARQVWPGPAQLLGAGTGPGGAGLSRTP